MMRQIVCNREGERSALLPVGICTVVFTLPLTLGIGVLAVAQTAAQSPPQRPSFEVASIKRNTTQSDRNMIGQTGPGTFLAQNSTVRNLIRAAYDVKMFQVVGGPSWIDTDHYDITAKPRVASASPQADEWPEMALMLQSLLEDRFKVRLHQESRRLPIYALVAAKGGMKLQHKLGNCTSTGDAAAASSSSNGQMYCGSSRLGRTGPSRTIDGAMITMSDLVRGLSTVIGREVIDRTGYTDTFDVHLEWLPDDSPVPSSQSGDAGAAPLPTDPNGASLFTAIQEQLGLRLESDQGPVNVFVIDQVERPEPN